MLDDEINDFRSRHNKLLSRKYGLLNPEPITDEEFKDEHNKLNAELRGLTESKKLEYLEHYNKTITLNKELAMGLAQVTADAVFEKRT